MCDTIDYEEEIWNDFFASTCSITKEQNNSKQLTNNNINNNKKECKDCKSSYTSFIINSGDILCVNCGLVQESSIISEDPEWNNYTEDGVINGSGIRCGRVLDSTNPYDTGHSFVPKYHWSWHLDAEGNKRYTNLSKIAIRTTYSSKQRAFDEGKYSFEKIQERLQLSPVIFNTAKLFWGIILKTDILKYK